MARINKNIGQSVTTKEILEYLELTQSELTDAYNTAPRTLLSVVLVFLALAIKLKHQPVKLQKKWHALNKKDPSNFLMVKKCS